MGGSSREPGEDRDGAGPLDRDEEVPPHLADLPDGCGCTEVWEALDEHRRRRKHEGREEREGRGKHEDAPSG